MTTEIASLSLEPFCIGVMVIMSILAVRIIIGLIRTASYMNDVLDPDGQEKEHDS